MSRIKVKDINMTEGAILPAVIKYAIPIVLGGIIQTLFNAADLAVVGNFSQSKTAAAAAVGAPGSIINLIINVFIGLSVGINVVLARALGSGNSEKTHRTVHTAILASVIIGAVVGLFGFFFAGTAMKIMKCPKESYDMAVQYMKIYFIGAPGILLYNFSSAVLRTKGDTKRPLIFIIIAGVLNVILNIIFVAVFHLEAVGVGLATMLTQYLGGILTVICLMKQEDDTRLHLDRLKLYPIEFKEIIYHGLPSGLTNALFSIANVQISSALNTYGVGAINGASASANLEGIIAAGVGAANTATIAFVGQNIGARKTERIPKTIFSCMFLSVTFCFILGNLMYLFGEPLIKLFNSSDELVIEYGMIRAGIMMRTYFIYGFSGTLNATLQAFGYSSAVMINSVFSICGLRTLWMQFIYTKFTTFQTLFWCYPVSMLTIVLVDVVILLAIYKKNINKIKNGLLK